MAGGASCVRCGAPLADGARFCTQCGAPAPGVDAAGIEEHRAAGEAAARARRGAGLVTCEECGASNAASRPICARCSGPLREEVRGGDALPDALPDAALGADADDRGRGSDTSPVLLALVLLAGLVTAGVLLALVTSRVTGPQTPVVTEGVPIAGVLASSQLDEHPGEMVVDGDTTTAWNEASPGDGKDEFLVLQLGSPQAIRRVLVWNGHQGSAEQFRDNGRVSHLRVEVGDRQFRVALLDIDGPQAIDLPDPVMTGTVRLVVERAIPGDRYTDLAISEVVLEAGTGVEGPEDG